MELRKKTRVQNKILQGDVLAPLLSSYIADKHIGLPAIMSDKVYLYKNKVVIPPLVMQDDTLGISTCGYRFGKMNNFVNIRANIMGLKYGRDKCEKCILGRGTKTLIYARMER